MCTRETREREIRWAQRWLHCIWWERMMSRLIYQVSQCLCECRCMCMCMCICFLYWEREQEEKKTCFTIQLVTKSSWVLEYLMSDLLPLFLKGIRRHLFALTICLSLSCISRIHSVWVREETLFNWVAVALVNELPVTLAVVKWIINLSSSTVALCTQVIQQAFRYERDYFPLSECPSGERSQLYCRHIENAVHQSTCALKMS